MEGKLIKRGKESYRLFVNDAPFAQIEESPYKKISLKNCEAIANGYDLWELAFDYAKKDSDSYTDFNKGHRDGCYMGFFAGFKKALSILGDKKFSEEDVISMIEKSRETGLSAEYLILTKQQTEWDVEIEMETCQVMVQHGDMEFQDFPKLDKEGCLILKRKI